MQILLVTPPGKFPTLSHDPGDVFSITHNFPGASVNISSINYHWWLDLCDASIVELLLRNHSFSQKIRKHVEWSANGIELKSLAKQAQKSLACFQDKKTFQSLDTYTENVKNLSCYLDTFTRVQRDLAISLFDGPIVRDLDYSDSQCLSDYARQDSLLYRLIQSTVRKQEFSAASILFRITSAEDLLSAMITARCIIETCDHAPYICLADHGYENFSLHIYVDELKNKSTLTQFFDSIIVSKDSKQTVLTGILNSLKSGKPPKGFLNASSFDETMLIQPQQVEVIPPPLPTFSPVPIFWTRLSEKKCYWSKCTFCVQNAKHSEPKPVSAAELDGIIDRLHSLRESGHEYFIFSDEALSPGFLKQFSERLLESDISIRWSCRCRIEQSFTKEIFVSMKQAGCYEILFGLESASSRILKLMKKHTNGLDLEMVNALFDLCTDVGIAIHMTMITGFPGETYEEAEQTVNFAINALESRKNATYKLNAFALFPETPIAAQPDEYGITLESIASDIPQPLPFKQVGKAHDEAIKITQNFEVLNTRLDSKLGWGSYASEKCSGFAKKNDARYMYFHSGHGTYFKTEKQNPFNTIV